MALFNKVLLAAAVGLGLAQAASATPVTCACEHQGSANDGLCEALPSQEQMSTLYTYNQYLIGATTSHEVPRYQYTFAPTGAAHLVGYSTRYAELASYTCQFPYSCSLRVTVHQYADGSMVAGMQGGGYPTYVGEVECWGGTVGEPARGPGHPR